MAVSVMWRWLVVLGSVLMVGLTVAGAEAQPTVTVTIRLAEAEWHAVRQEVLARFEAVWKGRVRAIDGYSPGSREPRPCRCKSTTIPIRGTGLTWLWPRRSRPSWC
jgi:hypothetical protein